MRYPTANKYGARKTEYNGRKYDSMKEAEYAQNLDFLKRAGEIVGWEPQVRIPLVVREKKICVYVLDFRVEHNDGTIEWVEVKGYKTDVPVKIIAWQRLGDKKWRLTVVPQ